MEIELLHNYIIVEDQKENIKTTKGGLMLSSDQREDMRFKKAKVIKVGRDAKWVKETDIVHYDKNGAQELLFPLEGYQIITEAHIILIEREKKRT